MEITLSIIIVHYKVKSLLSECIRSIYLNTTDFNFEIIVIDNDSKDGSQEFITKKYSKVIWIQNNQNVGFSNANNKASELAKGKYLLFLNPDTVLSNVILNKVIQFSEKQNKMGCLGVRMVDENGVFHQESKRHIPNVKNTFLKLYSTIFDRKRQATQGYHFTELDEFSVGEVPILTGAFLLIPKVVFCQVGKFDSTYFMYGEDIDLSYSVLNLGYHNYYYGKETIVHYKGESTKKNTLYFQRFFHAMEVFITKYYKEKSFLVWCVLYLGLKIRYYLALILYFINEKKDTLYKNLKSAFFRFLNLKIIS